MKTTIIQQKIFELRKERVILDFDIAALYGVTTGALNQAVKRNKVRFPKKFMFQLTAKEWANLRSQIVISSWGGRRQLPYAFTEHGVSMLASVLNSKKAIQMNIAIVTAFIVLRKLPGKFIGIAEQLNELKERLGEHDVQLKHIYDTIENLLDAKAEEDAWKNRVRVGFKTPQRKVLTEPHSSKHIIT